MKKIIISLLIAVFLAALNSCAWSEKLFDSPIENVPFTVSHKYGYGGYSDPTKFHTGYDIDTQGKEGIEVYAPFDGTVSYEVIYDMKDDGKYHSWSYGNKLELASKELINGKRYTMLVAHLSQFDGKKYTVPKTINGIELICDHDGNRSSSNRKVPKEPVGSMEVKKGQLIGYSGSCGNSTGPHLHIEIFEDEVRKDPDDYISREHFVGKYTASVTIDAENFPDNIFRNYVSRKFDKDNDGILSRDEAEAVTKMNVSNGKIASLKGIEYFTALNELDCSMNKLTELDISKNTALTNLSCFINQITELDVSKNTALIWLTCASNLLTELDISRNTALTGLSCSYNQLKSLDVSNNTALTTLDCGYNPQLSVDVSKNTSLEILWCEGNRLEKIDVSKNTALTELFCWDNQLKELDLSSNTALKTLLCWNNLLTEIDISSCPYLSDIECDKNVSIIRGSKPKIVMYPLNNAVKNKAYSFQFDAESKLPVTWSAESNSLPQGLTLSESGLLSGTPTKAGIYIFSVTASNSIGSASAGFILQVFTPVSISTSSLKAGTFGKSYSVTLKAKGTTPITWTASGLPAGLSINKTSGKISGKPSATGTFSVKIKAKNAASSKTKTLKLKINAVPPKLSGTLSDAELGIAYSSQLQLKEGSPVITWSASGLPEGLAIDSSTGLISGTPSGYSASGFNVTVTAKNSAGSDSVTVKLNVKGTAPKITTSKLTNATQGKSYKLTVKASGSKTITWKAKNLPSGLSINKKSGKISGTPKVSGSFKVTVYAANPVKTVSKKFTLKVKAAETESSALYSHDTQDNADFESESESESEFESEFESEALTGENNLYASPEEKEEHEDFSIRTGNSEDEIFIAAELGKISADNEGMYDFALTLSDDVPAGLKLIYLANSDNPSDDDNIAEFFDDKGNEISAVPENRKIIISVWLNKGVIYSPSVAVKK